MSSPHARRHVRPFLQRSRLGPGSGGEATRFRGRTSDRRGRTSDRNHGMSGDRRVRLVRGDCEPSRLGGISRYEFRGDSGDCILITIDGVDLDLVGNGSGAGVHALSGTEHINVYNGLITNFFRGIYFEDVSFSTVEDITVVDSLNQGLNIQGGQSNTVRGNEAMDNSGVGFRINSPGSIATENIAERNTLGLFVARDSIIKNNIAAGGFIGFVINCPSLVEGNVATRNENEQISLTGPGCVEVNNVVLSD